MGKIRCLECGNESEGDSVGRVSGKVKRFCSEKCNDDWWNGQPVHAWLPKVDAQSEGARELREERAKLVLMERADPWNYGYQMDSWLEADELLEGASELLVSGGNRAGKTLWAARKVIETLIKKDKASVLCCHTSNATSVTVQQPAVFGYLPLHLRQTRKGRVHYLNYSQKNGFTDGSFILPNGSRCDFLNYTQSENTIEGREADLVWCDELVPQTWVDTLRYRLVTRRGKMIVTQTPIEGVASVYKEFTSGARIEKWKEVELMKGRSGIPGWPMGMVPRVMRQEKTSRVTIFFFSEENPYNPWDEMKSKLVGAPTGQILTRAYGWATESIGKAFSRFRAEVHTIKRENVPEGGTLYMIVDPAGARNWFVLWVVMYEDKMIVLKEFPDYGGYGEWALPGNKADGKIGPAQTNGAGRSISEYRELFREIEGEIGMGEPMIRWIDPKAGGTPAISQEGGTTLIDLLGMPGEDEGMAFLPAPGIPVDQRIAAINSWLSFDGTKPMSGINQPKLYIVDDCYNLIYCLSEHTGQDGQKGASKDPIDCLGMLITSGSEHVKEGSLQCVGGGSY